MLRNIACRVVQVKNNKIIIRWLHRDHVYQSNIVHDMTRTVSENTTSRFKCENPLIRPTYFRQNEVIFDNFDLERNNEEDDDDTYDTFENEIRYATQHFMDSIHYNDTIISYNTIAHVTEDEASALLSKDWSTASAEDVYAGIKRLSHHYLSRNKEIHPSRYVSIFKEITIKCNELDDDTFMKLLKYLIPLRSKLHSCLYYTFISQFIDNECHKRYAHVPIKTGLLLCDIFTKLKLMKQSNFTNRLLVRLGSRCNRFTPKELVQYSFYLSVNRKPQGVNMYHLETQLLKFMNDLSINELGIIAMGFFKTKTRLRTPVLVDQFLSKLIDNMGLVDSVTLAAQVKLLRRSNFASISSLPRVFLRNVVPHIDRFHIHAHTHIAQYSAVVLVYEPEVIKKIMNSLHKNIHKARLKDFERIIFAMTTFNIDPKSTTLYDEVIEEISQNRMVEVDKHKVSLPRILSYLSYVNIYPLNLIKYVMEPDYVVAACSQNYSKEGRCHLILEDSLKIEVPEYDGPFLKHSINRIIVKTLYEIDFQIVGAKSTRFTTEILHILKNQLKSDNIIVDRILPHIQQRDIIIAFEEDNKPSPEVNSLTEFPCNSIKFIPEHLRHLKWVCFVLAHNTFIIRNSADYCGRFYAKVRQLERLGYMPIIISEKKWQELATEKKGPDFLKESLFSVIQ